MDDLQVKLAEARERHAVLEKLLAERLTVATEARALLEQASTFPRKRRDLEVELQRAEMDVGWISADLQQLEGRIRIIEADLAVVMSHDVELAQAARAAKAGRAGPKRAATTGVEANRGDAG